MTNQPFRVLLRLRTPIVMTDYAPTLDGMLYSAMQKHAGDDPLLAHEELRKALAFNEELGVYHASSLWFGLEMTQGLTMSRYVRVDVLNNKLDSRMFAARKVAGRFSTINLNGGPTKRRLTDRPAYCAPAAVFFGCGDPDLVREYLDYYRPGVGYDADCGGMGAYDLIELTEMADDLSLYCRDGSPNRPLPSESGIHSAVMTPPYYEQSRSVAALLPSRVRAELISRLK